MNQNKSKSNHSENISKRSISRDTSINKNNFNPSNKNVSKAKIELKSKVSKVPQPKSRNASISPIKKDTKASKKQVITKKRLFSELNKELENDNLSFSYLQKLEQIYDIFSKERNMKPTLDSKSPNRVKKVVDWKNNFKVNFQEIVNFNNTLVPETLNLAGSNLLKNQKFWVLWIDICLQQSNFTQMIEIFNTAYNHLNEFDILTPYYKQIMKNYPFQEQIHLYYEHKFKRVFNEIPLSFDDKVLQILDTNFFSPSKPKRSKVENNSLSGKSSKPGENLDKIDINLGIFASVSKEIPSVPLRVNEINTDEKPELGQKIDIKLESNLKNKERSLNDSIIDSEIKKIFEDDSHNVNSNQVCENKKQEESSDRMDIAHNLSEKKTIPEKDEINEVNENYNINQSSKELIINDIPLNSKDTSFSKIRVNESPLNQILNDKNSSLRESIPHMENPFLDNLTVKETNKIDEYNSLNNSNRQQKLRVSNGNCNVIPDEISENKIIETSIHNSSYKEKGPVKMEEDMPVFPGNENQSPYSKSDNKPKDNNTNEIREDVEINRNEIEENLINELNNKDQVINNGRESLVNTSIRTNFPIMNQELNSRKHSESNKSYSKDRNTNSLEGREILGDFNIEVNLGLNCSYTKEKNINKLNEKIIIKTPEIAYYTNVDDQNPFTFKKNQENVNNEDLLDGKKIDFDISNNHLNDSLCNNKINISINNNSRISEKEKDLTPISNNENVKMSDLQLDMSNGNYENVKDNKDDKDNDETSRFSQHSFINPINEPINESIRYGQINENSSVKRQSTIIDESKNISNIDKDNIHAHEKISNGNMSRCDESSNLSKNYEIHDDFSDVNSSVKMEIIQEASSTLINKDGSIELSLTNRDLKSVNQNNIEDPLQNTNEGSINSKPKQSIESRKSKLSETLNSNINEENSGNKENDMYLTNNQINGQSKSIRHINSNEKFKVDVENFDYIFKSPNSLKIATTRLSCDSHNKILSERNGKYN